MIEVQQLSFWYPDEPQPALADVSFCIREGEFVVLCGPSGCGKSTLLHHLKREIMPIGDRQGTVVYDGKPLESWPAKQTAERIGVVLQSPENQIVMDTVWHELAFSMENMGYELPVMRKRMAEMAHFFGLEPLLYKSVHDLSGGQKQMINLASVLLLQPKLLLLDEPTSQLDPVAARELIHMLHRLNQELSMTIMMSEHRLEEALPLADRVLFMERGKVKYDGDAGRVCRMMGEGGSEEELSYVPSAARLYFSEQWIGQNSTGQKEPDNIPLTVREGKRWIARHVDCFRKLDESKRYTANTVTNPEIVVSCRETTFQYEPDSPVVLQKLSLTIYRNECLAIVGGNGAGKSTLLQLIAGLLKPQRGKVSSKLNGKIGYLAQNPLLYFSCDSVWEELVRAADNACVAEPKAEIEKLLSTLQLEDVIDKHPHDISGGQQQKAALATVLLSRPELLLIDEPTKGLDPTAKKRFAGLLESFRQDGMTIVMVTHDIEFAAQNATRCAMLFDGAITSEGRPSSFFSENYFYTTTINRLVRDWIPDALTCEDVIDRWRGPELCSS